MTRFDAATREEREELFADAVEAHRRRESAFLTVEADAPGDSDGGEGDESPPPWIQYADGRLNLDCTDDELDRLKSLLSEFPSFTVDELTRPEEAEGTNVRVAARADAGRVATFLDRAFREVYERPDDYRAWVADV